MAKTIGYLHCSECKKYTYISNPNDLKIYYHPDDPMSLMSMECSCGKKTVTRVPWSHTKNFSRKGVQTFDLNDFYEELTEDAIEDWDLEAEVNEFLNT